MRLFSSLLLLIAGTPLINAFIKLPFGQPFRIAEREINKDIFYELPENQESLIKKINGFYGLIGPDIDINNVTNIFDLFTGDGVIQGIFFDNGELTFVKKFVRTDKLLYEEENGRIPNHNIFKILFGLFNKVNALPDLLGLANTALLQINKEIYALYERDLPYEIDINFENKTIETMGRKQICGISHVSAHTKFDKEKNIIETIDYDIMTNSVKYLELTPDLYIKRSKSIKLDYLPVIHDFWTTDKRVILFDSPLQVELAKLITNPMPVFLNTKKNTMIHILDKQTMNVEKYDMRTSGYLFHFANSKENDTHIDIYASFYDSLDFSDLNIKGKYRKVSINKLTKEVSIEKNQIFENLDIEFPILYKNRTIFRSIKNKINNGFVICEDLKIISQIQFNDRFMAGEPAIVTIDGVGQMISFCFDRDKKNCGYLLIINLDTYKQIEIPLLDSITLGFHSIFIQHDESS